VIRLGVRLTLGGGKEAVVRVAITAAAVALGVGFLLITLAGINAVNAQNARYAWLNTDSSALSPSETASTAPGVSVDPMWWLANIDRYDGQDINRVDLATTGPNSPVPPGIPHLPGPGEFYASPALSRLLATTSAAELADRYPGHQIGTIGASALPAPDSLIIIIGHDAGQLSQVPEATQVTAIQATVPSSCDRCTSGVNARGIDLVLAVVAAALIFPVLILIGTATRLAAARREQRFAAMRLVGATPRQVSQIAAVESTVAAVTGVAAGFGLFFLLRPAVASVPFTGAPFFPSDLSLSLLDVVLVAVGVPIAAAIAARVALRRVRISPLGVSRRVTPRAPRAWRLILLIAGIGELALVLAVGTPNTTSGQVQVFLPGFLLVMAGLVIAGPWLTMVSSRIIARRTSRPASLIAGRRLADNPQSGFRAVSGLVLALFVTSVAVGVMTTMIANRGSANASAAARSTLGQLFVSPMRGDLAAVPAVPEATLARLGDIPGVHGVTLIHANPDSGDGSQPGPRTGLVSCDQLALTPALGRCPAEGGAATISLYTPDIDTATVWPAAAVSPHDLQSLPVQAIAVGTDGSRSAIEQARTVLETASPYLPTPFTVGEYSAEDYRLMNEFRRLANVVVLTSLPIAGCSLAVAVAAGLIERKRSFSLLRLTGAPLGVLRRVVALESAVPLLIVAAVSTGAGFAASYLFLRAQLGYTLRSPGAEYYLIVAAALAATLAIIASTLPLLRRITGPETARNE
jgi:hypothetical protein